MTKERSGVLVEADPSTAAKPGIPSESPHRREVREVPNPVPYRVSPETVPEPAEPDLPTVPWEPARTG